MKKSRLDNWICQTESLPALSREALDALQLRRLNEALARLQNRWGHRCPYPDHLDSLEDLARLPFTTADMLSAHPERFLLTSQADVSRVISGATSGTQGPAKRVFYTEADTRHTVGFFAAGIGEMLSPGESCLIGFPFTGPFGLGDLIGKAVEALGAHPIPADTSSWGALECQVRQTRPDAFIGFPATLLALGRICETDFPIRRALLSGDACPQGVMDALENLLETPLFPHYGSRECGLGGAITCPAHEGMHLRENHIIPEIIDSRGNVLPEGTWGELVITTIGLEAMPLIRYRTGDYTRLLPPCPCGSVTRRIDRTSRLDGRMEKLDSALYPLEGLVDYAATLDKQLHLHARVLYPGLEQAIQKAASACFPDLLPEVVCEPYHPSQAPFYPAKRFFR